jgi:hypothetical protein
MHVEDGLECFINAPGLFWGEVADKVTKPVGVNGSELLDKNPRCRACYLDLGTKRSVPGAL